MIKKENKLRLIGDVHGQFSAYKHLLKFPLYSIQLGDFGFKYDWNKLIEEIDDNSHKVLGGNHDDYDFIEQTNPKHYLGDFGIYENQKIKLFFVRGGLSIDKHLRIQGRSWWQQEELDYMQQSKCIQLYEKEKPDFLISHVPPENLLEDLHEEHRTIKSSTGMLLSMLYEIHEPKVWVYAHMHPQKTFYKKQNNTIFICLAIRDFIDFDLTKNLEENINANIVQR